MNKHTVFYRVYLRQGRRKAIAFLRNDLSNLGSLFSHFLFLMRCLMYFFGWVCSCSFSTIFILSLMCSFEVTFFMAFLAFFCAWVPLIILLLWGLLAWVDWCRSDHPISHFVLTNSYYCTNFYQLPLKIFYSDIPSPFHFHLIEDFFFLVVLN